MKYYKLAKVYKNSTGTNVYYPSKEKAVSYGWWTYVKRIHGRLYFNCYNYSPTTVKHQYKMRALLSQLSIRIDEEIEAPQGLDQPDFIISHYVHKIANLERQIAAPGTHVRKNKERHLLIDRYRNVIEMVKLWNTKHSQDIGDIT